MFDVSISRVFYFSYSPVLHSFLQLSKEIDLQGKEYENR